MSSNLRAGAARVDITPPTGIDLTGFVLRQNPNDGVRDPLFARALVLDDGDRQVAFLSCDLLGFDRELVHEIRDRVALVTRIAAPQILVACTHTHGGPATMHLNGCGEIAPGYVESLLPRLVEAVVQAQANLQPATLALGSALSTTGVHNRRTPGDVVDPEVGLLSVSRGDNGAPLAVVVNYSCHPTSLNHSNRQVTADYPGLVCSRIEEATGATTLFLMGAIGDVGPVTRGEETLVTIGNAVADAVLAALPAVTANEFERIETAGEEVALPLLPLPDRAGWNNLRSGYETAALAAEAEKNEGAAKIQWALLQWSERMFEKMQDGELQSSVAAEIQLIRVGDVVIVGVPGEYFVELGLQIKQALKEAGAKLVMICGFANGNVGYIPARRAYAHGGYEVTDAYKYYGYPAAVAPEGGEQIVATAQRLAAISKRG